MGLMVMNSFWFLRTLARHIAAAWQLLSFEQQFFTTQMRNNMGASFSFVASCTDAEQRSAAVGAAF